MKISFIKQQVFIDLCCVFVMIPQIMQSSQAELVLYCVCQLRMIVHDVLFIHHFVGKMQLKSVEQCLIYLALILSLLALLLGVLILIERIVAASLKQVDISVVVVPLDQLIICI